MLIFSSSSRGTIVQGTSDSCCEASFIDLDWFEFFFSFSFSNRVSDSMEEVFHFMFLHWNLLRLLVIHRRKHQFISFIAHTDGAIAPRGSSNSHRRVIFSLYSPFQDLWRFPGKRICCWPKSFQPQDQSYCQAESISLYMKRFELKLGSFIILAFSGL